MTRPVLAPAALAAAIAIPFLIGSQSADTPTAPDPREASLVVRLTGEQGAERPYPLRVQASGEPAPSVLVDETGLHAARVAVADALSCADQPPRSTALTGSGATEWCLELIDVPEHEQVRGVVPSSATAGTDPAAPTSLGLTVTHRDDFWDDWPLFFLVTGLLSSLAVTWLLLDLRRRVRATRLDRLVARNEAAAPAARIEGLRAWVARRRHAGADAEELIAFVGKLVARGPATARHERASLEEALAEARESGAAGYGLHARAEVEGARATHEVGDLVDPAGAAVDHPARVLAGQVARMTGLRRSLDALEDDIAEGIRDEPACRERPVALLRQAIDAWSAVDDRAGIERADEAYEDALAAARAAWTSERCGTGQMPADRSALHRRWVRPEAWPSAEEGSHAGHPEGRLRGLAIATGLVALIAFAIAAVTVYLAVYDADATFGSWQDLVALFAAAAASSFTATLAGLLSPWGVDLDEG